MPILSRSSALRSKAQPIRKLEPSPGDLRLQVAYHAIDKLKSYPRNARIHDVDAIAASIKEFGLVVPILKDKDDQIVAGEGIRLAAKQLGYTHLPTISLSDLTKEQAALLRLGLNKIPERGGWSREILKSEFEYLTNISVDLNLEVTGFEMPDIDILLMGVGTELEEGDLTDQPQAAESSIVPWPGDLWQPGDHRLLCGDALESGAYDRLMGEEKARLVAIDPPYNVPISGHVLRTTKHSEFAMASGEMSDEEFQSFLKQTLGHCTAHAVPGAIIGSWMDWRGLDKLLAAARNEKLAYINLIVWRKSNCGMGSLYRSQHELMALFKKPGAKHRNLIQLGKYGRNRSNVWTSPGCTSFGAEREILAEAPTPKPVGLISDFIRDVTHRGEIVLDTFLGSGTTLLAAEKTGRICYGMEISPRYIDLAIRRWQKLTGRDAILAGDGRTFAEIAESRTGPGKKGGRKLLLRRRSLTRG